MNTRFSQLVLGFATTTALHCGPASTDSSASIASNSASKTNSVPAPSASVSATSTARTREFPIVQQPPPRGTAAAPIGPVASASQAERQAAVLSLFSGNTPTSRFSVVATDPDTDFDPTERHALNHGITIHDSSKFSYRIGAPRIEGPLSPEEIKSAFAKSEKRIRSCYERGARLNPTLAGRVNIKCTVNQQGVVTSAEHGGYDFPDKGVVDCIVRAVSNTPMPPHSAAEVAVQIPFMFSPTK